MTKRITSIDPLQLAKVLGILYGVMGLLVVPVFLIAFILPALLSHGHFGAGPPPPLAFLLVLGRGRSYRRAAPLRRDGISNRLNWWLRLQPDRDLGWWHSSAGGVKRRLLNGNPCGTLHGHATSY